MADRGEVKLRELKIKNLIDFYHQSYKSIAQSLVEASESGKIRKQATLTQIRSELTRLGDNVDEFVRKEIPQYYADGANIAAQDMKKLGAPITSKFGVVDSQAIAALVDEVNSSFAESMSAIGRSAGNILSSAQKQQIQAIIAEGRLTGETLKNITASVKQQLQDNGLAALTDKAGREWQFDTYAEMLIRTKSVEARNQGLANAMLKGGYDLVQVSNHNSSHPECAYWESKILSISGATPKGTELPGGYVVAGTLAEATESGLFHPNCQHAVNVINPGLAAKTNAYDNPYNQLSPAEKAKEDKLFAERNTKAGKQNIADNEAVKRALSSQSTRSAEEIKIEQLFNAGKWDEAQKVINSLPASNPSKATNQSVLDAMRPTRSQEIASMFDVEKYAGNQAVRNRAVAASFDSTFPQLNGFTNLYDWKMEEVSLDSLDVYVAAEPAKVAQYVKDLKGGATFPTLMANVQEGSLNLLDGAHRIEALKELGITNVPMLVGYPKKGGL